MLLFNNLCTGTLFDFRLPTCYGDTTGAKGNALDMVTRSKIEQSAAKPLLLSRGMFTDHNGNQVLFIFINKVSGRYDRKLNATASQKIISIIMPYTYAELGLSEWRVFGIITHDTELLFIDRNIGCLLPLFCSALLLIYQGMIYRFFESIGYLLVFLPFLDL